MHDSPVVAEMAVTSLDTSSLEGGGNAGMFSPTRTPAMHYDRDLQNASVGVRGGTGRQQGARDVTDAVRHVEQLSARYSPQEAEAEAHRLFTGELSRLQATLNEPACLPECDLEPPAALADMLVESPHTIPPQLTQDEVQRIHSLARLEDVQSCVHRKEQTLLELQCDILAARLQQAEEGRLALELSLARLHRALPTHDAWLREQRQKLQQLQQAAEDPCAIIGIDTEQGQVDLAQLETAVKKLSRQNAEMEQEGLIKSLNACHAMEMLTTSLKLQTKWCNEAHAHADDARRRSDEAQRVALVEAKEEEALLKQLHDATSRMAETKKSISLTQRRLLGAAPLPSGAFIGEGRGRALTAALKEELSRGSTRLLETLCNSHDFNVIVQQGGAQELIPAYARSASPPMPAEMVPAPTAMRNVSPPAVRGAGAPRELIAQHQVMQRQEPQRDMVSSVGFAGSPRSELTMARSEHRIAPSDTASPVSRGMAGGAQQARHLQQAPMRSGSAEEHQRILSLQEQAQRQLAGVAATLKGLAAADGQR